MPNVTDRRTAVFYVGLTDADIEQMGVMCADGISVKLHNQQHLLL
jgi:hypothetical protein